MKLLAAVLVLTAAGSLALAQTGGSWTPETSDQVPLAGPVLVAPTPACSRHGDDKLWTVDFLAGLPTGLRLQRTLFGDHAALLAEGFFGVEYLVLPTVGLGLRGRLTVLEGPSDALLISPGVDFYAGVFPFEVGSGYIGVRPFAFGLLAADVDVAWRHSWSAHFDSELGVKLGFGGAFAFEDPGLFAAQPVAGVFVGCRF